MKYDAAWVHRQAELHSQVAHLEAENKRQIEANAMLGDERDAWAAEARAFRSGLTQAVEAAEFFRAALLRIRDEAGQVCNSFETCTHRACAASYAAWSIADAALQGETIESANTKAVAAFSQRGNAMSMPQDPFAYRPPRPEQIPRFEAVAQAISAAYEVIRENCPESAERELAIRDLQRARMWANAAISFDGEAVRT